MSKFIILTAYNKCRNEIHFNIDSIDCIEEAILIENADICAYSYHAVVYSHGKDYEVFETVDEIENLIKLTSEHYTSSQMKEITEDEVERVKRTKQARLANQKHHI